MTDGTDVTTAADEQPQRATEIRTCKGCGSHFATDQEEAHCGECVAWAELYRHNKAVRHLVRR